jgi:hypothetical protein
MKKIIDSQMAVTYPKIELVNPGIYYKMIRHPIRNVKVYISSLDLWALESIVHKPNEGLKSEIIKNLNGIILMLQKIDAYNNLKKVEYEFNEEGLINIL